jgi:hypothetical protein
VDGVIVGDVASSGGTNGTIPWQVETEQFVPFGSVEPNALVLAPGQSQAVTVFATTPSSPGDLAGSITLTSDLCFGGITSIPVALRSLVDVRHGARFGGAPTGGNGRDLGDGQHVALALAGVLIPRLSETNSSDSLLCYLAWSAVAVSRYK